MISFSQSFLLALPLLAVFTDSVSAIGHHNVVHRDTQRMHQAKKIRMMNKRECRVRGSSTNVASVAVQVAQATTANAAAPVAAYVAPAVPPSPSPAPAAPSPAPAAPSPAPAPAPASPAPAPASSSGKTGLGLNNPDWVKDGPLSGHVSWIYNWSPWCSKDVFNLGIECVPMLWGWKQLGTFNSNLGGYAALGVKSLLFVNEPDQSGQSHMSPQDAATLWWQTFSSLKGKFYLVGPALTASPGCIQWQQTFMGLVSSTPPDAMALHWYGTSASSMIAYLEEFHAAFPSQKIWVTEFACQNFSGGAPCSDVPGFMTTVLAYMKNQWWIEKYAWFGYLVDMSGVDYANQIVKSDGSGLNDLGWQYVS